jgi:dUTP pyrophosphatase
MNVTQVSFVRLNSRAFVPRRAHDDDAGFDLYTVDEVELSPGQRASAGTGIAIALPPGTAGLVLPRSGNAARHGVSLVNTPGLIDSGYRGEVKVLLINHGSDSVVFQPGDRVAQLVVIDLPAVDMVEVDRLDESERSAGGFGSTGR